MSMNQLANGLLLIASTKRRAAVGAASLAGIAVVGWIDYVTGIELRVFPLYYVPVGFAAWHLGRWGSIPGGLLCAAVWVFANSVGGLRYSDPMIWIGNTSMQAVSFLLVGGLVAMLRERIVAEHTMAGMDALTTLFNRRAFHESGERMLMRSRRVGDPVTIAYLDLDRFKAVNDSAGHAAGDRLLRTVAHNIRLAVRPTDLVARLGGDEFAILLPNTGAADAENVLERVRLAVIEACDGLPFKVTGSLGAAAYAVPPPDLETMLQRADAAMYAAKQAGRNCVRIEREPAV